MINLLIIVLRAVVAVANEHITSVQVAKFSVPLQ
ncbi:TPA: DinQ-like type I toxin DqlB, partial [Escherichia coli]